MNLLSWDGIEEGSGMSLRDVIENMRRAGALGEMLGRLLTSSARHGDAWDPDLAAEFMGEAGGLVQALGVRALELLDAEATPEAPAPAPTPRTRTTTPRAVRLCAQVAGVEKEE